MLDIHWKGYQTGVWEKTTEHMVQWIQIPNPFLWEFLSIHPVHCQICFCSHVLVCVMLLRKHVPVIWQFFSGFCVHHSYLLVQLPPITLFFFRRYFEAYRYGVCVWFPVSCLQYTDKPLMRAVWYYRLLRSALERYLVKTEQTLASINGTSSTAAAAVSMATAQCDIDVWRWPGWRQPHWLSAIRHRSMLPQAL